MSGDDGETGGKLVCHNCRFIFRGRQANDDGTRRTIYSAPIRQLGAPPAEMAVAGRMNPAGISVLYGSLDAETCAAELRLPVGGSALIGKFEIIRPLPLLDLPKLENAENDLSYFHPRFATMDSYAKFIRGFHNEVKRTIIPGREHLGYVPTQVVAEYLWTRDELSVDGVIFGSAQVSGSRYNIALFPHACNVEGSENEGVRDIEDIYASGGNNDDEPDDTELVYYRPHVYSEYSILTDVEDEAQSEEDEISLREAKLLPYLRLDQGSIQLVSVKAISYDIDSLTICFQESEPARRHKLGGDDDFEDDLSVFPDF